MTSVLVGKTIVILKFTSLLFPVVYHLHKDIYCYVKDAVDLKGSGFRFVLPIHEYFAKKLSEIAFLGLKYLYGKPYYLYVFKQRRSPWKLIK